MKRSVKNMKVARENDYQLDGDWWHNETEYFDVDEEDAVEYLTSLYGDLDDDEIDEMLFDFDYEDEEFIQFVKDTSEEKARDNYYSRLETEAKER